MRLQEQGCNDKRQKGKMHKKTLFKKDLNFRNVDESMSSLRTIFAMMKPTHLEKK
jgi:hypothetical protein